jgi:hypothetical protein
MSGDLDRYYAELTRDALLKAKTELSHAEQYYQRAMLDRRSPYLEKANKMKDIQVQLHKVHEWILWFCN